MQNTIILILSDLSRTNRSWPDRHDIIRFTCFRCSLRAILRLPFLRFNITSHEGVEDRGAHQGHAEVEPK